MRRPLRHRDNLRPLALALPTGPTRDRPSSMNETQRRGSKTRRPSCWCQADRSPAMIDRAQRVKRDNSRWIYGAEATFAAEPLFTASTSTFPKTLLSILQWTGRHLDGVDCGEAQQPPLPLSRAERPTKLTARHASRTVPCRVEGHATTLRAPPPPSTHAELPQEACGCALLCDYA